MAKHRQKHPGENIVQNEYAKYFIRDGMHVGDYEGMYRDCADPWNHVSQCHQLLTDRLVALNWMRRLRRDHGSTRVVEFGCGLGHLTKAIKDEGFGVVGVDVAESAIDRARSANPDCLFIKGDVSDYRIYQCYQPDIIYFAHLTWCILDKLDVVIDVLKAYASTRSHLPTFLIHLLETYHPGVQKYGNEKFTNNCEIKRYFSLHYIESGQIFHSSAAAENTTDGSISNYFVARI